ncbi:MAG: glycosyltransferase [Pseudomonadota bacterium]
MSQPPTSYILLTYNQRETVEAAVQSALDQTGVTLEIVISDDHSQDDTFDVIQKTVADYDGPHKIILNRNERNLGLAGNVEKAHDLSSGDVLIAAAGDDKSYSHRSAEIVKCFAEEDALLVCSYADVIDLQDQPVAGNFHTALFYKTWDVARAARSKALYIGATGAWRRELYDKYGALDPEAYEDLVLGFRAALEGSVRLIKEPLVQYRLGAGMTNSDNSKDLIVFKAKRRRIFAAQQAVMRQRTADAAQFGLPGTDRVFDVLRKEQIKADLGAAYSAENSREFRRLALRHPLFALYTWRSERRRARKLGF